MALRTIPKRYEFIPDSDYQIGGTAGANIMRRIAWNQNHLWAARGGILAAWGEPVIASYMYPLFNANILRDPITGANQLKTLGNFIFPNEGNGMLRGLFYIVAASAARSMRVGIAFLLPGEQSVTTLTPIVWTSYSTNTGAHYLTIETKVLASHKGLVRCQILQQSDGSHADTYSGCAGAQVVWKAYGTGALVRSGTGKTTYLGDMLYPGVLSTTPVFDASCAVTPAHLRVIDHQMNALAMQPRLVYSGNFGQAACDTYNGFIKTMGWFPLQGWPLGVSGATWTLKVRFRVRVTSAQAGTNGYPNVYFNTFLVGTGGNTNAVAFVSGSTYESYTDYSFDITGQSPTSDSVLKIDWVRTTIGANNAIDLTVGARVISVTAYWVPSWSSGTDTYQPIDESALVGGAEIYNMQDRFGRAAGPWYLMNNARFLLQKRAYIPVVAWYGGRFSRGNFAGTGCDMVNGNYAGPGMTAAQNPNGISTASGYGYGGTSGGPIMGGYNLADISAVGMNGGAVRMIGQTSRAGITGAPNGDDSPEFATLRLIPRSGTTIKSYLSMDSGARLGGWATSGYEQPIGIGLALLSAQACVGATASTAADVCLGLQGLYAYELPLTQSNLDAL